MCSKDCLKKVVPLTLQKNVLNERMTYWIEFVNSFMDDSIREHLSVVNKVNYKYKN